MASGAKSDRAQLRRLLDQLDAGDVLMVTRLDRLQPILLCGRCGLTRRSAAISEIVTTRCDSGKRINRKSTN